jgi:hypothetical protein
MLREIRPAVVASGDRWGCIVAFIGRTARGRSACPWGRGKLWMRTVCWGFRPSARRRSLDAMTRGRVPLDTEGTSVFYGTRITSVSAHARYYGAHETERRDSPEGSDEEDPVLTWLCTGRGLRRKSSGGLYTPRGMFSNMLATVRSTVYQSQ